MTKAIIFDFFDVFRTDAYKAWLWRNNIPHSGSYAEASLQLDTGAITSEQFLQHLSVLADRPVTLEELEAAVSVDAGVVDIAQILQNKGYTLALLSNAPSALLRGLLSEHQLDMYFDEIFISSEIGVAKPHPAIFHHALEKLEVAPADALFIDDNPLHTRGAEQVGIPSIQFLSAAQLRTELVARGVHLS